uniref:Quinolinate phosphoribosyl transferase C-terminal domain-containing protein n=1 Tax=Poecilia mexicana TaxID=48701 RepID=A0A3B3XYJ8_9TELE
TLSLQLVPLNPPVIQAPFAYFCKDKLRILFVSQAVKVARSVCGFSSKIEVECRSTAEGREAAAAGADIVMLDNFQPQELHVAARDLKNEFPSLQIEASGGVTPENVASYFSSHVDIISLGCITQGCPVSDFSLKVQKPGANNSLPVVKVHIT